MRHISKNRGRFLARHTTEVNHVDFGAQDNIDHLRQWGLPSGGGQSLGPQEKAQASMSKFRPFVKII